MFRRSGSVACFVVEGEVPAPHSAAFRQALESQRFRTIELAASEDSSFGWITPSDPTGDSFDEDLDYDAAVWLRVRSDKKLLPKAWIAIHRAVAERSRGRPLTARERRELKLGLLDQLLPKVLPTVKLIDVLWLSKLRHLLLFATGKGIQEDLTKLFHRTFSANLLPAEPRVLAQSVGLERTEAAYLDQISPVAWPRLAARPTVAAEGTDDPAEQTSEGAA